MRIRSIKPETWTSHDFTSLPIPARLTYIGLWTYADDEGRGRADARLIRAAIWPLDDDVTVADIEEHLTVLAKQGLIVLYDADGVRLFAIPSWRQHQHPRKPQASKFPAPVRHSDATGGEPVGNRYATGGEPVGNRYALEKEKEKEEEKERKEKPKSESAAKPRRRNNLVDTLAEIEGSNPGELTRPHARALGVAVAEIKRATPDVTPDEIRRRAAIYRRKHPDWSLTGPALAKHWAACSTETGLGPAGRKLG